MTSQGEPALSVKGLKTHFFTKAGVARAVDGVSFELVPGEILGIVGESGSGKSVTGMSIMGLVDPPGRVVEGSVRLAGKELITATEEDRRQLLGNRIAMIFQEATTALNPVLSIDTQMIEAVKAHQDVSTRQARKIAIRALQVVGIPSAEERIKSYPHEFSGGMRQRVLIATALLNEPDIIIADEPTTALDVTIQAQILSETQKLCRERGTSLIWITHDLTVVAGLVDKVCVMYAGKIVERGPVDVILDRPKHPYTVGLIGSIPSMNTRGKRLSQIPGMTPSLLTLKPGCAFRDRCLRADERCLQDPPETWTGDGSAVRCFHPVEHPAKVLEESRRS
ncbi:ABC transporter ATP-binding protein [Hoeflea sp. WL0058]|uniref:ABC transporter ATP-binding protein n=1 Tax=Flavimaribacter sediminis TaxID=2865987 RepID=A0AAE3CZM8_9HYPH|nr:ABC transporter ATP-binding protein [Flavimaribacter sediminis]MBW8635856.1 ABC transporter ATP-binding protein [Flavimaribacter sediminis]